MGERAHPPSPRRWFGLGAAHLRRASHPIASNFLADRCTHLAAMVAYYALLSLIPFLFLVLSFIGWFGEPSESSFLIEQLQRILPGQPVGDLVSSSIACAPTPGRTA